MATVISKYIAVAYIIMQCIILLMLLIVGHIVGAEVSELDIPAVVQSKHRRLKKFHYYFQQNIECQGRHYRNVFMDLPRAGHGS